MELQIQIIAINIISIASLWYFARNWYEDWRKNIETAFPNVYSQESRWFFQGGGIKVQLKWGLKIFFKSWN